MKKHHQIISFLVLFCLTTVSAQALPKIEHWINDDGVPVYFVHTPELPMLDIKVMLKAGDIHNGENLGVAGITTPLLKYGTQNKNVEQINDALNDLGSGYGSSSDVEAIKLSLRSLSDKDTLDKSLDLFIEIISQPSFPEDEFLVLKRNRLYAIKTQNDNLEQIMSRTFREQVYAGHLYANPAIGTEESISAMTLDDVRDYYQNYFVTENMIIIAVGDISRPAINTISHRISSAFPRGTKADNPPPVSALETAKVITIPYPSDQVHVKIGQPFIEAGHPDFFALQLGNHILGGGGFGSRIMEEIRVKRGLAYAVGSGFNTKKQAGIFTVGFQTRKDQADTAINVVRQILKDFVDFGPTQEEIAISLANIRGSFALRHGSNSSILGAVGKIAFYGLDTDYLNTYLENFDHLDAEAVHDAFKRHLHPDKLLTVIVGGDG